MGSGNAKGSSETNTQLENSQVSTANALTSLLGQQQQNSQSLFNLAFPGQQVAENQAETLASGDPYAIARLIAPQTQQISQATAGAKQNVLNNSPSGGTRNLAIQQADVNQGAQVGALASQGVNNAFNSLAALGQSGIGQGISSAGTAISAGGQANQAYGNVVGENIQQKGATLGAFTSAASDAAYLGAAFA